MKKNFFKYVAVALVAMMLVSSTALAATVTTTTYKGDYITVSTEVSGADADEQVTYLVHNSADADIADTEIIYINQKAALAGVATFDYKVAKGETLPSGTAIIAGSTSGIVSATAGDNIDPLAVTVINDTDLQVTYDAVLGNGEAGTLTIAEFTGGKAYVNDIEYTGAVATAGGQTYTVTFVADEEVAPTIGAQEEQQIDTTGAPEEYYVARFATVSIPESTPVTTEVSYGIVFCPGSIADLTVETEGAIVYPAMGNSNGRYAVKLVDGGLGVIKLGDSYTTRAYICVDGVYTYAD
ncbi:MAG: hypothetical protein PHE51_11450 [Eubacteriales bacterium]|nr:hypothetical protein [Eubacteriales bacterium]